MTRFPRYLFALFLCLASLRAGAAPLLFTFDDPGYPPDTRLYGQGAPEGTKWGGTNSATTGINIKAGVGVAGTRGVELTQPGSGNPTATFAPSALDLPGFDGTRSLVAFSVDYRFVQAPTTGGAFAVLQIGFNGSSGIVRFGIGGDGGLTYSHRTGTSTVASGLSVDNNTQWVTLSGVLDYTTKTYYFEFNGNRFVTESNPEGIFDFYQSSTQTLTTLRIQNVTSANHRGVVFDNLSLTVIPEPSTSMLAMVSLLLAGVAFLHKRRGRRLACLVAIGALGASPGLKAAPAPAVSSSLINVKDFGAQGDGQHDDGPAIQKALNLAAEYAKAGHSIHGGYDHRTSRGKRNRHSYAQVYFPAGTYRTAEMLVARGNVSLKGEGAARIVQSAEGKDLFYFDRSVRVIVENLTFEGGGRQLLFFTNNVLARILIRDCRFENANRHAVECRSYTKERLKGDEWNLSKPHAPYLVEELADGQRKATPNQAEELKSWYNSTLVSIENSTFEQCRQALDIAADMTLLSHVTVNPHPETEGAVLVAGGRTVIYQLKGTARPAPGHHPVWVESTGTLAMRGVDLTVEGGRGMPLVLSRHGKRKSSERGVLLEDVVLDAATPEGGEVIRIAAGTVPFLLSLTHVRERSGKQIKAINWEQVPSEEHLKTLRFADMVPVERHFAIVFDRNDPSLDESLPQEIKRFVVPAPTAALTQTLSLPHPPRPKPMETLQVLDARDYGVDPASRKDQTKAIRKLFEAAAKAERPLVVFPGGGVYHLSDTIKVPGTISIRATGASALVQTDSTRDIFEIAGGGEVEIRQIDFIGGRHALDFSTATPLESHVWIDFCAFKDQSATSIVYLSGKDQAKKKALRRQLHVSNTLFFTRKALIDDVDEAILSACWMQNTPLTHEEAFVEHRGSGKLRVEAMLGNPTLWTDTRRGKKPDEIPVWPYSRNTRWFDVWGHLYAVDCRFGGESGGMCNAVSRSRQAKIYINGGVTRFANEETRAAILYLEEPPQAALLRDIASVPIRVDQRSSALMGPDGRDFQPVPGKIERCAILTP